MAINKEPEKGSTLITGASSGIGKELARVFAQKGHPLVLVARDEPRLDQLANELRTAYGVGVEVVPQDLSGEGAVRKVVNRLEQKSIVVDILVNNAGFDVYGNFWETDLASELQMIRVNQVALTELCKYLLGGMRERGGGKILNVGSTGSFIPTPFNAVYSATKAYVLSFSESLAEELRGSGVTVTVLCPGATRTEFQQRAGITSARLLKFGLMDAKSVAESGYRGVMKGKRIVVPGFFNKIQVFTTRLLPRSLMTRIAKSMLAPGRS